MTSILFQEFRLTDETSIVETPVGETNEKPKRLRIVKLPETLTGFLTSRKTQIKYNEQI